MKPPETKKDQSKMKKIVNGKMINSDKADWQDSHDHGDMRGDCYGYTRAYFRQSGSFYRMTTSRTGGNGISDRIEPLTLAELIHDYEECNYNPEAIEQFFPVQTTAA